MVTACSTGAHAIGDAARLIALDDADVMVAGGTESPVCRISIAGFAACKALATAFNDEPTRASRPYDRDRDGFVMGEGAGVVVLEELEHAKARGATIYAEVIGYGLSGDAYHITAPAMDGDGAYRCMQMALKRAGVSPDEIDYVNAHGTSTMADTIELAAVERVLGNAAGKVAMSSTKSMTGHLLGAAGAIEAIFSTLAIRDGILPPTINLDNPSVETPIDLVPNVAKEKKVKVALSNSFGFGGTNASLVLRAFEAETVAVARAGAVMSDDAAASSRGAPRSSARSFAILVLVWRTRRRACIGTTGRAGRRLRDGNARARWTTGRRRDPTTDALG